VTLKIGINAVPVTKDAIQFVVDSERLGIDSVWVPEFWGFDALTPIGALAVATDTIKLGTGIVQLGSRSPAMLAMSALSLQSLSDGRFRLGIGTSGPQVIEGWHGVEFAKPIQRTRETIEIIRIAMSGDRLEYDGSTYQLPLPGGEGKAIRAAAPPAHVPIYVASLGPTNLRLTGELTNGWIGNSFFPETAHVFFDEIAAGAAANGKTLDDVDLTVSASCEFTDNLEEAAQRHASEYAFTFGAMGSGNTNFYNQAFAKQGFADDVASVERLWREGDRDAARARVPAAIGSGTNLLGNSTQITERLRLYEACGVNTIRVNPQGDTAIERLDCLAHLLDLVAAL
jgi:F420-dependent oxidoreductase-like protein